MARGQPIEFNGYTFKHQTALQETVKAYLAKHHLRKWQLTDPEPLTGEEEFLILSLFLCRHPRAQGKLDQLGEEFSHMAVRRSEDGFSAQYVLVGVNGAIVTWSYATAVKGRPKSTMERWYKACREAVNDQIVDFKRRNATSFDDPRQVDHVYPFGAFADAWFVELIERYGEDWFESRDRHTINVNHGDPRWGRMTDSALETEFAARHAEFYGKPGALQLLSKAENIRKGGRIVDAD